MAAEFSATDVALNGFRVVWQRPRAVLYWAALQFAFSLALTVFITLSAGPAFEKLASIGFQPGIDPGPILAMFREVLPTYIAVLAAALVLYSVLYAAMNRAVLRPADDAFGYLRLSADELRQLVLFLALLGMTIALYVGVVMVSAIFAGAIGYVAGAGGASAALVGLVIMVMIVAMTFLGVRFSLASARTFATGRIDIFGSWRMTQGRFWPLFGTYAIAFSLYLVVLLLGAAIAVIAAAIAGGAGSLATAASGDMSSLATSLRAPHLVYLAVSAVGTALSWPITMTPPAVIYRALSGDSAASAFS